MISYSVQKAVRDGHIKLAMEVVIEYRPSLSLSSLNMMKMDGLLLICMNTKL